MRACGSMQKYLIRGSEEIMNILLTYGGKSCEHDISLITASLARGYFSKHNVFCCYFDENNVAWFVDEVLTPQQHKEKTFKKKVLFSSGESKIHILQKNKIKKTIDVDACVNCCHGVNGEDGAVAGILQMANIAGAMSGVISSGVAMDKVLSKKLLQGAEVSVLDGFCVERDFVFKEVVEKIKSSFSFPVIVKPATLGSSIGIAVAKTQKELKECLAVAFEFDNRVLVEKALTDFYELNCSVMKVDGKIETSKIEQPLQKEEILSFADKYLSGEKGFATENVVADESHFEEVEKIAKEVYQLLDMQGVIRIDFIVDRKKKQLYLNEINTIPGSLAYPLWKEKYSKTEFGDVLAKEAVASFAENNKLQYRFLSSVLTSGGGKK